MIIMQLCVAGIGAFFGGGLRSLLSDSLNTKQAIFPWGTFLANLIGSFLIGIFVAMMSALELSKLTDILLATGFCGGLTTFSTFSLEVLTFFRRGQYWKATIYWVSSVIACIGCVYLGMYVHKIM